MPLPHDPEPPSVRNGRRFLYDARLTSSNGEASCSSCHVFGNTDDLSWNLGDPDGATTFDANMQAIPTWKLNLLAGINNVIPGPDRPAVPAAGFYLEHHPLKGPLFTKSLRGLANGGPMHWGGDRSGGCGVREDPASLDEDAAFKTFNVAFRGLTGAHRSALGAGDAGLHGLHAAGRLPAESEPRARQLAHARAAEREEHLPERARRRATVPSRARRRSSASTATPWTRRPASSAAAAASRSARTARGS